MRLMSRYILLELLKVFLVTLMGMTMVLLLAGVTQEAVRQGLGPGPRKASGDTPSDLAASTSFSADIRP